jgi:hypothetical protein
MSKLLSPGRAIGAALLSYISADHRSRVAAGKTVASLAVSHPLVWYSGGSAVEMALRL